MKLSSLKFFLLIFIFVYSFSFTLENYVTGVKGIDPICKVENLECLLKIEEENIQKDQEDVSNPILLTGDFENINNSEMRKIVNHVLCKIGSENLIDEGEADLCSTVMIIHKSASFGDEEKVCFTNNDQQHLLELSMRISNLGKKIYEKVKLQSRSICEVPIIIKNFLDNQNGIDTTIVNVKKITEENNFEYDNHDASIHRRVLKCFDKKELKYSSTLFSNSLIRIGPKMYVEKSGFSR